MIAIMAGGFKILCDGDNCDAIADAPVALRAAPAPGASPTRPIEEWLFVAGAAGEWRHYCRACQAAYLEGLSEQPALAH